MSSFVVGDVIVNADKIKVVSVEEDNVVEIGYCDDTITQVKFDDYGKCLEAYRKIASIMGAEEDLGGSLVV